MKKKNLVGNLVPGDSAVFTPPPSFGGPENGRVLGEWATKKNFGQKFYCKNQCFTSDDDDDDDTDDDSNNNNENDGLSIYDGL